MYIFWVISGIFFLILDVKKQQKNTLVLSITSLFCATICYKFPDIKYLSIICAPIFYFIFNLLITKILQKEERENEKLCNLTDFKGKIATVTKDIGKTISIDGLGRIDFENNIWDAKSIDDKEIKAGSKVQIISQENHILNVKAINTDK